MAGRERATGGSRFLYDSFDAAQARIERDREMGREMGSE